MPILDVLADASVWNDYLDFRRSGGHLTKTEEKDLTAFVEWQEYLPVVEKIRNGGVFSSPRKKQIKKIYSAKTRTVYIYPREESYVLKLLAHVLSRKYDSVFSPNLYSFRSGFGVHRAIRAILRLPPYKRQYSYKADISDYFNSIDVPRMTAIVDSTLKDDADAAQLIRALLENPCVYENGMLITEKKGVMAGTPLAVFLANLYLTELDELFWRSGVFYARYSDDMIIFAESPQKIEESEKIIKSALARFGLQINPEKEVRTGPGEAWTFLGVTCDSGIIDISKVSADKLKGKLRRKARAIKRWQIRNGVSDEKAVLAYIRAVNRKLMNADSSHELTWTRWYFPLITTDKTLHELDGCIQYWARFVSSGRHRKKNYDLTYQQLKDSGYVSLVNLWYKHKAESDSIIDKGE